ncbi:MAG: lipoate--protein ligase family protein [Firmicutes bacterium]|nr:lipoate--protein ligase family protein [Bacillota bacterium]
MNMAIDEAILEAHAAGHVPPTLRFYGWSPAAVSIGYFQRLEAEVDLEACRSLGVDVVRRPTGGRAVLHESDELTYSVVIRQELLPGDVIHTYRVLCEGLLAGIHGLGVEAGMATPDPGRSGRLEIASSSACFNSPSWYEVETGGKKVVGSAQVRHDGVILQHGSILLELDADRLFTVLRVPEERRAAAKRVFLAKATSLDRAAGRPIQWAEAKAAMVAGFETSPGLELTPGGLTPEELVRAAALAREKYGSPSWNAKK